MDPYRAVSWARRAVELDGGKDADFLATLAEAHAAKGEFGRAVEVQQRAVDAAVDPEDKADFASRLRDYRRGRTRPATTDSPGRE